jgi:hypothetical protein
VTDLTSWINRATIGLSILILLFSAGVTASAAPPFRIQQQNGAWWLIAPSGEPFFSRGVCCVNMGTPREKYVSEKPGYAAWRQYPQPTAWADATLLLLKTWGFTTIGGWSDYSTLCRSSAMTQGFTPVLHLGASSGAPWFDMWDPKVIADMDKVAREQILPIRDNPRLMGYYTDNEMGWWNGALFKMTMEQPSSSRQRQRLIRLLRDTYDGKWQRLERDFEPVGAASFAELEHAGVIYLHPGSQGIEPIRRFLAMAARRYYQLVRDTIRRYDQRGLVLGDRYQSFYYPEVARAAAPYVDAVSTNLNANWDDGTFARFYLDTLHGLTQRPVIVGEFYMTAAENRSGNRNDSSGFPVVPTQRDRAAGFRSTLTALMQTPFVIGADWFQYYDEPRFGRDDGENYDMGLVDIEDRAYQPITATAAALPAGHQPPVARADATMGVPPAPAAPMAELSPMKILGDWDRERGFVPPASRLPLADMYVCWAPDALYLGLYAYDFVEDSYYRDKQIPEADRMEWSVRVPARPAPIRARIGAGRAPNVEATRVTVAAPSRAGDVRNVAIMKLPATAFGKSALRAGDRVSFHAILLSHARAYRAEWSGDLRLAPATVPAR